MSSMAKFDENQHSLYDEWTGLFNVSIRVYQEKQIVIMIKQLAWSLERPVTNELEKQVRKYNEKIEFVDKTIIRV